MSENPSAAGEAGAVQAWAAFMAELHAGVNQELYQTMHGPHVRNLRTGVALQPHL